MIMASIYSPQMTTEMLSAAEVAIQRIIDEHQAEAEKRGERIKNHLVAELDRLFGKVLPRMDNRLYYEGWHLSEENSTPGIVLRKDADEGGLILLSDGIYTVPYNMRDFDDYRGEVEKRQEIPIADYIFHASTALEQMYQWASSRRETF